MRSGGGFHCYWLLANTYEINTATARQHIDQSKRRGLLSSKAIQPYMIWRGCYTFPGSQNHKYQPPRDVSFVRFDGAVFIRWLT